MRPRRLNCANLAQQAQVNPESSLPHARTTVAPPGPHRSLPVAPLIGDKRCYGEATVRPPGRAGESGGDEGRWVGSHFSPSSGFPPLPPTAQRPPCRSFRAGRSRAAMLALGAIHYSQLLAVGAGFARGPFLHAQKRQQPGHAEEHDGRPPSPPAPPGKSGNAAQATSRSGGTTRTAPAKLSSSRSRGIAVGQGLPSMMGACHEQRWRYCGGYQQVARRTVECSASGSSGKSMLLTDTLICGQPDHMGRQLPFRLLPCPV